MNRASRWAKRAALVVALGIVATATVASANTAKPWHQPTPGIGRDHYDPSNPDAGYSGDIDSPYYLMMRNAYEQERFGSDPGVTGNPRETATAKMKRQLLTLPLAPSVGASWASLGPQPIPNGQTYDTSVPVSGRVTAIAVHPTSPNTVFVGGAMGGVWRSTDGGTTWIPIFDTADSLAIGSLAISPSQPTTLYVGTGEGNQACDSYGGVGLYRIDNATSTPILSGPINPGGIFTKRSINKILVSPTDPADIWTSTGGGVSGIGCQTNTRGGALYRSTNATSASASVSFSALTVASFSSTDYPSDMELFGTASLVVAVNSSGIGGIYRTTNRNDAASSVLFTKTRGDGSGRIALGLGGGGLLPTIIAAGSSGSGQLAKSTDGGATFTTLSSLTAHGFCGRQCWYDIVAAISPTDGNRILVGGSAGDRSAGSDYPAALIRSTDGATFVTAQGTLHADTHAIEFAPSNSNIVYEGNDGGVWRSADGGATWSSKNQGLSLSQFESVATHVNNSTLMIGGTQDNGTQMRLSTGWTTSHGGDGGYAAIDQSSTSTTNVTMYHTFFFDQDHILYARYTGDPAVAAGNWGLVGCYSDAPNTPPTSHNGIACTDNSLFYAPLVLGPGSPNSVYLGTTKLYRSSDKGNNHTVVSQELGVISSIAVSSTNDAIRLVGTSTGNLYQTRSGSSTLSKITGPWISTAPFISAIALDPGDSRRAYVALSRYFGSTDAHVYRTTNLDAASPLWEPVGNLLPDVPVNTIAIDPANTERVYLGTDIGVYRSEDRGDSWYPFMDGMPNVAVYDLAFAQQNTAAETLRAATHGRGMYEILIGNTYPRATVSPVDIGFGYRVVGGQSQADTYTLRNSGTDTLHVLGVTKGGSAAFSIVSDTCTTATLGPGQSCATSLRFAPTAPGSVAGSLTFNTDTTSSPDQVFFDGIGTSAPAPAVSLSTSNVSLGGAIVGSETSSSNVTITNTGDALLQLGSESLAGTNASEFRVASSDCRNRSLEPGGICTVGLRMRPASAASKVAQYSISSNAAGTPHTVSLSGQGLNQPAPQFVISDTSIPFGDRQVGAAAASRTVTVSNTGTAFFAVNEVAVSGGSFSKRNDGCGSVAPGGSCTFDIAFAPSGIGARAGEVTVSTSEPTSPHSIALSGNGVPAPTAGFAAAPSRLDYPSQTVGGPGDVRSTTVTNDGNANLSISSVQLAGSDPTHFAIESNGCAAQTLAPAASCVVSVRFQPTATGGKAASLRFTTNLAYVPDVFVAGIGLAPGTPSVTFSPNDLVFSSATVGTSSTDRAIVVSSNGTAPVAIGSAAIAGTNTSDYSIVADGCSAQSLSPSTQCTILVRFTPSATGTRSAAITIPTNAGTGTVGLFGTGDAPGASASGISTASQSFGSQTVGTATAYQSILISSTGTAPLSVTSATIEGTDAPDFTMLDYCSGKTVPRGGTCPIYVAFKPSVAAARTASLRVVTDAATQVAAFTGTGILPVAPQPGVVIRQDVTSLGYARIGQDGNAATITVSSNGQTPLTVSGMQVGGTGYESFRITRDTCTGGTFATAGTCTVVVRFRPTTAGSLTAGVIISTNAGAPVASVNGIGDVVTPRSSFTTPSGSVLLGSAAPVAGTTTDDYAVTGVTVSYVNALGASQTVTARLVCAAPTSCAWTASPPALPGLYTAIAQGTDAAGNVEPNGPAITVLAV